MRRLLISIALRQLIRVLALASVLCTLGWQGWQLARMDTASLPPLDALPYGLHLTPLTLPLTFLVVALLAILLTLFIFLPSAITHIFRCPDVLVPLAFLTPLGAFFLPWMAGQLARSGLTESRQEIVRMVVGVALETFFAAWMTCLIVSAVQRKQADALSAFRDLPVSFLRTLPLLLVGWGLAQLAMPFSYRLLFDVDPLAAPIAGGVCLVGWNLVTAALLPCALNLNLPYLKAVVTGFEISFQGLGRWLLPLLAQMALLGLVTWVFVARPPSPPSEPTWHVHGFWTGGYESFSRWVADITQAVGAPTLFLFQTVFALLFGTLAIGIKLVIVERINPLRSYKHREKPDPFAEDLYEEIY